MLLAQNNDTQEMILPFSHWSVTKLARYGRTSNLEGVVPLWYMYMYWTVFQVFEPKTW